MTDNLNIHVHALTLFVAKHRIKIVKDFKIKKKKKKELKQHYNGKD